MMESHSFFLSTSHDDLLGNMGLILRHFISLSTNDCGGHLMESGQSQNLMVLSRLLLKKLLRSFDTAIECR